MRDLPTIAFIRPALLLRRNGPVPGILAADRAGAIMDKSERRCASHHYKPSTACHSTHYPLTKSLSEVVHFDSIFAGAL
jgi:hypothetical protein